MKRREFIVVLGGAASWPLAARGQQPVPVIGILAAPAPPYVENVSAILRDLSEAGFVEGHNVAMEFRWAEGQLDRLPALAADLVKRQVAVISLIQVEMAAKRLDVLRELVPGARIIGLLANPSNRNIETVVPDLRGAAGRLGLQVVLGYANSQSDLALFL